MSLLPFPARAFIRATFLPLAFACLTPGALAAADADGFYTPTRPLVPRAGTGEGTLSPYGHNKPAFEKNAEGIEVVQLPAAHKTEANLLWTYWGHRRPAADQWPVDAKSRTHLTVVSAADVTLDTRLFVRADDWSAPVDGPAVKLAAGRPAEIEIPLPATLPPGAIQNLRVVFSAKPAVPALTITEWSVGEQVAVALYPSEHDHANPGRPLTIAGRAAPGADIAIQADGPDGKRVKDWRATASADDGRFSFQVDPAALPAGPLTLRAASRAKGSETIHWSADAPLYLFPILKPGHTLPMLTRDGRNLLENGKPWAFAGFNYTHFLLEYSLPGRANYQTVAEHMRQYGDWGVTAIRVPLHLGMFQPRPGVFPDHPDYESIIKSHNLDTRFYDLFEYTVAVAGHYGIRVFLDWHEMPDDPYRYFVGGNLTEKKAGQPGKGIAWLSDPYGKDAAHPGDPRHTKAIVDTNRWLARRFKGNGNLAGFEVPYNEPHSPTDSAELDWRRLTAATILPIITEDPDRLTFGMPPAWGHSNVLPSTTWFPPDHLTGMAPHHYLGNGPVALRADAKSRHSPWLARDVAATFDHSMFAAAFPNGAAPLPVFNGESGEHGYASFLPDMDRREATSYMIEAQLLQTYAAGWTGSLGWTLTDNATVYKPVVDLYEQAYRRFAPVYSAGPIDQMRADVLFVQNTAAVPVANGLNHACVPFARLVLDLHLAPAHYMTDDQLLATGLVQMAVGLEQVEQAAAGLRYKAAIVDTRNLDERALDLLRGTKMPVLVVDDAATLTREKLAAFLKNAGLALDEKTPAELQLVQGPGHLLVYRRSGDGAARAFPRLVGLEGAFQLVDEQDRVAFSGTAETLARDGLAIDLPKWRTAIYRIRPRS